MYQFSTHIHVYLLLSFASSTATLFMIGRFSLSSYYFVEYLSLSLSFFSVSSAKERNTRMRDRITLLKIVNSLTIISTARRSIRSYLHVCSLMNRRIPFLTQRNFIKDSNPFKFRFIRFSSLVL